jgi:hypothetical protein
MPEAAGGLQAGIVETRDDIGVHAGRLIDLGKEAGNRDHFVGYGRGGMQGMRPLKYALEMRTAIPS